MVTRSPTHPQLMHTSNHHESSISSEVSALPGRIRTDPWLYSYSDVPQVMRAPNSSDRLRYEMRGEGSRSGYAAVEQGHLVQVSQSVSYSHPSHPAAQSPSYARFQSGQMSASSSHHSSQMQQYAPRFSRIPENQTMYSFSQQASAESNALEKRVPVKSSAAMVSVPAATSMQMHSVYMHAASVPIHPYPSPPYHTSSGKPSPQQVSLQPSADSTYLTPSPEAHDLQSSPEGWSSESPNGPSDTGGHWATVDNRSPAANSSFRVNNGFHHSAATKPLSHFPH